MKTQDRQNFIDVVLMAAGSVEGVVKLAIRNNLSPTQALYPGRELIVHSDDIVDSNVVQWYAVQGVFPATEAEVSDEIRSER
ncbi:hypothetical protein [Porphyromonas loveana]|uniref:hypothetical protein n=1 Tax=Porphyromonas loveana TaxID=1884669 RepID=UPI00359F6F68